MVHKRVRSWTSGGRLKTLLISRAIYVQMSLTFFLLKARMFKSTTPAPGTGPYFTSVSRNDSQLEIIASFHAKSRRLLMLVVKNKSTSLRWELKSIFMSILWNNFLLYWRPSWPPCHVVPNQEYSLGRRCAHFTLPSPLLSPHQGCALRVFKIRAIRKGKQYNKAIRSHLEMDLGTTRTEGCALIELSCSFSFLCNVMWLGWPRNTYRLLRNGLTLDRVC